MDSYTLMNKMRKARRKYTLSAGCQGLFMELIAICNEEQWSGVFKCTNGELKAALNVEDKTLIKFRDELAEAGLLVYISGKSRKQPCQYSLNGCLNHYPLHLLNGGKIYSGLDSDNERGSVGKKPDLIKHKSKTETKSKTLEVVVDEARAAKFNEAVDDFFEERDQNSNVQFPEHAHLPEKEKNSAKKEKELPALEDAQAKISATANWRNVLEHHKVSEADREGLFKLFYEQNEDTYRIRYPSVNEMSKHFYFWIAARNKLELLKPKLGLQNDNTTIKTPGNGYRKRTEEAKRDVADFVNRSSEFLRRTAG